MAAPTDSQKISVETIASALDGTEYGPVVQAGANRRQLNSQILTYIQGAIAIAQAQVTGLAAALGGKLAAASNLSDVANAATARGNLSAASNGAQYLALATDAGLLAERVFTPGRGLESTDAGANAAYTLDQTRLSRGHYERMEDFDNTTTGTSFTVVQSGTGATVGAGVSDANHPGVAQLQRGTTTTGRTCIITSSSSVLLGGGAASFEALVQVSALSDGTDTYKCWVGFIDATSGESTDGIYFEYDQSTDTHWRMATSNGAVRTKTNTTSTVPTATWQKLRIDVNAAGTSAEFFVDGVSVGTIATNMPNTAGHQVGVGAMIIGSAGTTNRTFDLDYMWWRIILTTSR